MPREALIAVGAGFISALMSMTPLAFVAPVPLFMAGLALGFTPGAIAAASALAAKAFLVGLLPGLYFGLSEVLPSVIILYFALTRAPASASGSQPAGDWRSLGDGLAAIGFYGAALVLIVAVAAGDKGLSQEVEDTLKNFFAEIGVVGEGPSAEQMTAMMQDIRQRWQDMLHPVFPGLMASLLMLIIVINGVISQGILGRMDKNIRPRPSYTDFDLPQWLAWPLVVAAALSLVGGGDWQYICRNAAMVLALPYFLLGAAVVHHLSRRVSYTRPILMAFYLVIFIQPLWAGLVVAGIGIAEQWVGLRDRSTTSLPQSRGDDDN